MNGRHLWKDIKGLRQCPYCKHGIRFHKYVSDLSDLIDTDLWTCQTCATNGMFCTVRGPLDGPQAKAIRRKKKDPFEGGGL